MKYKRLQKKLEFLQVSRCDYSTPAIMVCIIFIIIIIIICLSVLNKPPALQYL